MIVSTAPSGQSIARETEASAQRQWPVVADQLRTKFPKLAKPMDEAEADVPAFMTFSKARRLQIHSTKPLER